MCQTPKNLIRNIGSPSTLWVIPSIHSDSERLKAVHDAIFQKFSLGDRILYLGNYTGYGGQPLETIDEILEFRRLILSYRGVTPSDIIYLRGTQEEIWHQLTQLHYARTPVETLLWMLSSGLAPTLQAYGYSHHDAVMAAKEGMHSLIKFIGKVQMTLRAIPGYYDFVNSHHRAAYTEDGDRLPLLFVPCGIDPNQALETQVEGLTWHADKFDDLECAYDPFEKVIRGFDPKHRGLNLNGIKATLDGGCGFGGDLICAGIQSNGQISELMEA